MDASRADLVCLHLAAAAGGDAGDGPGAGGDRAEDVEPPAGDAEPAPYARSLPGICDAIGGQSGTEGLGVLSTLEDLKEQGLLRESTRPVAGVDGERTVYELTDAGRERTATLRRSLADETVVVREHGRDHEVRLGDVDRYLEGPSPMVTALVDRDADGVVHLDEGRSGAQFVDRQRALHILEDVVWGAEGDPRAAVLQGPTGIGKTELSSEFASRVEEAGARVVHASAGRDAEEPYSVFRSLVAELDAAAASPFARERAMPVEAEDYEDARRSLFYDVLEHLRRATEGERTLVVLDNLEWLTPAAVDLLSYLLARLDEAGVRLVCSYNTEFVGPEDRVAAAFDEAAEAGHVERLQLEPLSPADVAALARWLLDAEALPEGFADDLHDRTGGNPLFVTASVRHMLEEHREADPATAVDGATELSLPSSARAVIEARLENLAAEHRELLETAAVVGERIPLSVLAAVTDRSESALRDIASVFVGAALWERAGTREVPLTRTFRFGSAVIRETVLDRIDDERRAALHEAVAEAMADAEGVDAGTTHATVASHYERAGEDRQALEHYRRAGEAASDVYAHEEAAENYRRALELADATGAPDVARDVRERLGDVHTWTGDYAVALDAFEAAAEGAADTGTRKRLHRKRSLAAWHAADYDAALAAVQAGLNLADGPDADDPETARLHQHRGMVLVSVGDLDGALESYERALELAEALDADAERAGALRGIGTARLRLGDDAAAAEALERAVDLWRAVDDRRELVWALNSLAALRFRQGDLAAAEERFRECRDLFESIGFRGGQAAVLNNLGAVAHHREQPDRAVEYYREALEIARGLREDRRRATLLANLAELHTAMGELATATDEADRAVAVAEEIGATDRTAAAVGRRAVCRYYAGDLDGALADVERAVALAEESGDRSKHAELLAELGRIERSRGNVDAARYAHEDGLAQARENGIETAAALNRAGLLETAVAAGEPEDAAEHAEALAAAADVPRRAELALGRYRLAVGEHDAAEALLSDALAAVEDLGYRTLACEFEIALARVAAASGDQARATELLDSAVVTAEECGLDRLAERARDVEPGSGED